MRWAAPVFGASVAAIVAYAEGQTSLEDFSGTSFSTPSATIHFEPTDIISVKRIPKTFFGHLLGGSHYVEIRFAPELDRMFRDAALGQVGKAAILTVCNRIVIDGELQEELTSGEFMVEFESAEEADDLVASLQSASCLMPNS